ncbi:hypothetical protein [Natrinema sp. SYSU A 869]|uniref:hypothetical protein n=1 Tax=Natrinema sp. SYSU A 869 TaxID=2871694 RepID=UPI001CA45EA6|nr:hypothetical protein [Natrinema sp. SYSU A 869]
MSDQGQFSSEMDSDEKSHLEPVNGIAEAISFPEAGEEVTLRTDETATVERVDRRRHHSVILKVHPFRTVQKRTIVEYSRRVGPETDQ